MQQALDLRDFEIERRLEAFARARLSPDPRAVARTRARVMREARLQFEAARIAAHVVPAMTMAQRRPLARRLAMPLLAASVWVGIAVGSVAAAQAGGPLYPTRLWIEAATLPAAAPDRATAEISRLDARLGDAMSAAARGDTGAVAAALEAYRAIADEAITASAGDEDLEALIGAALARHQAVLTAVSASLEAKGNTTAANAVETAIQRAIAHNAAVVAGFANHAGGRGGDTDGDSATGSGSTGGGGTGGGSGSSSGGSGGNAGGNGGAVGADNGNGGNGQTDKGTKPPKPTPAPTADPGPAEHSSPPNGQGGNAGGDGGGNQR